MNIVEARREILRKLVATLAPGQTVTATFSPMSRPAYAVTGTLEEPEPGALNLGGWEYVRLETGLAPGYLVDLVVLDEFVVAEPGVFYTMAEALYHSGPTPTPSLSHSGAKVLLQGPPARFRYSIDHRKPKSEWDFGHVWHSTLFGQGDPIVEVEAKDWRTKAAQACRAAARAEGMVPMLSGEAETVRRMVEIVRADPRVAPLLAEGSPEVSMFGRDPITGCWIRGRIDWVTPDGVFVDGKTTVDASPEGFNRSVEKYGYAMQAAWYEDLSRQLDLPSANRFVFVVQEKAAPYLVNVFELDDEWLRIGRALYRLALDLFAKCVETDEWPGYEGVTTLSPPYWVARRLLGGEDASGEAPTQSGDAGVEDLGDMEEGFEALLAALTTDAPTPPMQGRTPIGWTPDYLHVGTQESRLQVIPNDVPEYVTYRQARHLTGASDSTLRRHTAEGRLPAVQLAGVGPLRVSTSTLLGLIQAK